MEKRWLGGKKRWEEWRKLTGLLGVKPCGDSQSSPTAAGIAAASVDITPSG